MLHHTLSKRQVNFNLKVRLMFLTSEPVYGVREEVPKLVYYHLLCKPVKSTGVRYRQTDYWFSQLGYHQLVNVNISCFAKGQGTK